MEGLVNSIALWECRDTFQCCSLSVLLTIANVVKSTNSCTSVAVRVIVCVVGVWEC